MIDDGVDVGKVFSTLIEPSAERLESAVEKLRGMGLREGEHFKALHGLTDMDVARVVEPGSQDIIGSVAAIHHHAYLDVPVKFLGNATRPGGYISIADWHNSMWEHPNRVYRFLVDGFDWETKDRDLAAFVSMYPGALKSAPQLSGPDEVANEMIRSFWRDGWAQVRGQAIQSGEFNPRDDILMLEGHRPVKRYVTDLEAGGYRIDTSGTRNLMESGVVSQNPQPLVDGSAILMQTVAQKV